MTYALFGRRFINNNIVDLIGIYESRAAVEHVYETWDDFSYKTLEIHEIKKVSEKPIEQIDSRLTRLTIKELRAMGAGFEIKGYYQMNREELIRAIMRVTSLL